MGEHKVIDKEQLEPAKEREAVKEIVRSAIYICIHLKSAKALFDPLNSESLCYGGICITDISESPLGFVVEEDKTKSYIYYNSKLGKVKYSCSTAGVINIFASAIEGMKIQLEARINEEMKDMTEEIKELILKKVNKEIAAANYI